MTAIRILRYIRNNDYIMDLLDEEDVNEAIAELEALENRSCDGRKHYLFPIEPCGECSRFYADKFERKTDEN